MTTKKLYSPMTVTDAEAYIIRNTPVSESDVKEWDDEAILIYAETLSLHRRLDDIENQANEMMSPEKMMDMAQSFLGGGLR